MRHGKRYQEAVKQIEKGRFYSVTDAVIKVQEIASRQV